MNPYLDPNKQPHLKVSIFLTSWTNIDCLIDTGFSDGISLPEKYYKNFKQLPTGYVDYELADGRIANFPVYKTKVRFRNIVKDISLSFSKTTEALIGIEFLEDYKFILGLKKFLVTLD